MLWIIIYCLVLLFLFLKYRGENSIRRYIISLYFISSCFSVLKVFIDVIRYPISSFALIYYIICILILLAPFIKFGFLNCTNFVYPYRFFKALAFILIIFGIISLFYTIPRIFTLQTLVNNLEEVRKSYYDGINELNEPTSFLEILTNWVLYIQFLAPFLSLYFYIKKEPKIALILAIVGFSPALKNIIIGERETIVIALSNYLFAYIFWVKKLNRKIKKRLRQSLLIMSLPLLIFVILMTVSRFGNNEGILNSLIMYIGDQPYNFSYFFTYLNLPEQQLDGRLCFSYLFPKNEAFSGLINDYISSPEFLNVFAGIPGSFYLDFSYTAIIIISIISSLFYFILKKSNQSNSKSKFGILFSYIVYFQIVFMGIFYYDFRTGYAVIMTALVLIAWFFWYYLTMLNINNSILKKNDKTIFS